ncbi:protein GrpE [Campylobacterota bacterium]|nr:protein GrpE [Campylobacterota bacterium]
MSEQANDQTNEQISKANETANEELNSAENAEHEPADPTTADDGDLKEQLKASEERFVRAYAEFENIKKRLEKEKYQAIDYASEQFAKDLLPVMDALEMALKIEDQSHYEQLKEGVNLTKSALLKAFEKHGISPVTHENGFDPNIHEAIMQVSSDTLEENAIAQVMQQGYRYKERTLRPSLVSVSKK